MCKLVCLIYFHLTLWSKNVSVFLQMAQVYSLCQNSTPLYTNSTFSYTLTWFCFCQHKIYLFLNPLLTQLQNRSFKSHVRFSHCFGSLLMLSFVLFSQMAFYLSILSMSHSQGLALSQTTFLPYLATILVHTVYGYMVLPCLSAILISHVDQSCSSTMCVNHFLFFS